MLGLAACGGAPSIDAGPDGAAVDAGAPDARRPPPPYCPSIRITTTPGACEGSGDEEVELAIEVVRGRVLVDPEDPALDAVGRLVVLVYDHDPACETCPDSPVAVVDVDDARIGTEPSWVETVRVPRGPVWLFGWIDDDGDTASSGPRLFDVGDLTTAVPQVALACSATSARVTLDRRLGVLTGSLSIDPAIMPSDVAGDVWLLLYTSGPLAQATLVGGTILRGVDLTSPVVYTLESFIDYDGSTTELVPFPATLQIVGILDVDADGEVGEPGDLVALASPGSGAGVLMCLDDARLTFEQDVVFNVVLD